MPFLSFLSLTPCIYSLYIAGAKIIMFVIQINELCIFSNPLAGSIKNNCILWVRGSGLYPDNMPNLPSDF